MIRTLASLSLVLLAGATPGPSPERTPSKIHIDSFLAGWTSSPVALVEGTVSSVSRGRVTVAVDGLPAYALLVHGVFSVRRCLLPGENLVVVACGPVRVERRLRAVVPSEVARVVVLGDDPPPELSILGPDGRQLRPDPGSPERTIVLHRAAPGSYTVCLEATAGTAKFVRTGSVVLVRRAGTARESRVTRPFVLGPGISRARPLSFWIGRGR